MSKEKEEESRSRRVGMGECDVMTVMHSTEQEALLKYVHYLLRFIVR